MTAIPAPSVTVAEAVTDLAGAAAATPAYRVDAAAFVLPVSLTAGRDGRGPRFGDEVWDVRPFVPRTTVLTRADFATITDHRQRRTAREYLYSRINRAIAANQMSGTARPLKITSLYGEFREIRRILADLAAAGAATLAEVTRDHLETVLAVWKRHPATGAGLVGVVKHLAAHGAFLTDRLAITPWPGRGADQVAGRIRSQENTTPRIPENVTAPLIKAAVFYVETAAGDVLAARAELARLRTATQNIRHPPGTVTSQLEAFIDGRRASGRGIPALPVQTRCKRPDAVVVDGIVQAPNLKLSAQLAGIGGGLARMADRLTAAGAELGYETGGLDTAMSPWPGTGQPWRPRLDPCSLAEELTHLRTACWITIAYLSGMRDAEVRELTRECAVTEPAAGGRTRYKLRGRVFKDRQLPGEQADWVVLEIVHRAVGVLLAANDDPTHLFGRSCGSRHVLLSNMHLRLAEFSGHVNDLFAPPGGRYIPLHGNGGDAAPWTLSARQFRRTLAWHIAHQPFGIVAGTRQYQHAQVAVFEGYAGTSASGFAAEVEAEQAAGRLDYLHDLYRDWDTGGPAGGGAARRIDAEFARIRAELGDLPGTIASAARLRTMLEHLALTLHPGVLGDCFFQPDTAVCLKRAKPSGAHRPLPMLNSCLSCPNARRTPAHLPRLQQARDQARQALDETGRRPLPPLQRTALHDHLDQLDQLITQCTTRQNEAAR